MSLSIEPLPAALLSKEYFRSIYDHSPVGMGICDLHGRYVAVNAALCEFLGYTEDELLQRTFADVTHPGDVDKNIHLRQALIESSCDAFQIEKRYLHKNGNVLWAKTVVSVIHDVQQRPILTVGQMMSIDNLKASEQSLKRSRKSLANAQRLAQVGDWDWNIADNVIHWSDEIYRIFGVDPGSREITYDLFLSRVHVDDRALVDAAVRRAFDEHSSYEIDHRIQMDDGTIKIVHEIGSVAYDANGTPQRMVGTVQDITERHAYEQTLLAYQQRIQKLAAHNDLLIEAERKRIAQEIHDEIGQLLTVLKIDMQLCRSAIPNGLPLRQHTDNMLNLLEKTIASVRNVTHNLRPPALNLGLAAALEWLAQDVGRRTGLHFVLNCDLHEYVIDDRVATAAFRVAQESITNIIRHANASEVFVALTCDAFGLTLEIADDGDGFDIDVALQRGGFGLLGMRERITALGGKLNIESDSETGTTLRIVLPVKT